MVVSFSRNVLLSGLPRVTGRHVQEAVETPGCRWLASPLIYHQISQGWNAYVRAGSAVRQRPDGRTSVLRSMSIDHFKHEVGAKVCLVFALNSFQANGTSARIPAAMLRISWQSCGLRHLGDPSNCQLCLPVRVLRAMAVVRWRNSGFR
jgi:hypothetical protein